MKTFLVTGASQGFGLAVAEALLAASEENEVFLGVRNLASAPDLGPRGKAVHLDLSSMERVDAFAKSWKKPLAGLVNNAGVQITDGLRKTEDGFEETLAVNYLAAYRLTERLLPHLRGGRVLFIGSGTHVPDREGKRDFPGKSLLKLTGFTGARYTTLEALAHGETEAKGDTPQGRERYATSKLLDTVAAYAFTARIAPSETTFLTLDPGMMPGTGLARTAPAAGQLVWKTLLKWIGPIVLPGTTTTERSAQTAVWLLTSSDVTPGEAYAYDRTLAPVQTGAREQSFVARVDAETRALLALSP